MKYISTRSNIDPVSSAEAINLGMVPSGGLFVPGTIPHLDPVSFTGETYSQTAYRMLRPLLTDFTDAELAQCIERAYNHQTFDVDPVIEMVQLDKNKSVMELWHGPTAAFKDVALQIMPHFMQISKKKLNNKAHTVILVATSGDTGKAALEGFKDCEGISIIVFYPHGGVSEIQKLQMATTDGSNTHVVAVKGNFDDCQTGVKNIFTDLSMRADLEKNNFELSSANSINWGRLCPQIVYYIRSYLMLAERGVINSGDPINYCVPTGNFGNILAGYYAKMMGLPINKLICASNKNKVLADFFELGTYDRNREFYKTMSPSMDILISSNLERFLFELNGHNSSQISSWFSDLGSKGSFTIDKSLADKFSGMIEAGWVDEQEVLNTIGSVFKSTGYVLDTHTAVGTAVCDKLGQNDIHTVIASTASPYKFSCDVLKGLTGEALTDEFKSIERVSELSKTPVHRAMANLRERPIRHKKVIEISEMKNSVLDILNF